jgi:hypothetical protein
MHNWFISTHNRGTFNTSQKLLAFYEERSRNLYKAIKVLDSRFNGISLPGTEDDRLYLNDFMLISIGQPQKKTIESAELNPDSLFVLQQRAQARRMFKQYQDVQTKIRETQERIALQKAEAVKQAEQAQGTVTSLEQPDSFQRQATSEESGPFSAPKQSDRAPKSPKNLNVLARLKQQKKK